MEICYKNNKKIADRKKKNMVAKESVFISIHIAVF